MFTYFQTFPKWCLLFNGYEWQPVAQLDVGIYSGYNSCVEEDSKAACGYNY